MKKHQCKSCENLFEGSYCNSCGEKVIKEEDRKLKHFVGEFINAITFADNKLWRTLKLMIVSPGTYARHYCEGRRKDFMKPISLFFLANLLYFLFPVFNTFTTNLDVQRIAFSYSDLVVEIVDQEISSRGISYSEYRETYDKKTAELSKLLLIVMALLLALFSKIIHFGSPRKYIADHFTIALEQMSYIILFCVMGTVAFWSIFSFFGISILSDLSVSISAGVLLLYFAARSQRSFFKFKKTRLIINTILGLVAVVFALWIYRMLLFFITYLII